MKIAIPSLASAAFTSKFSGVDHDERWFEVNASRLGAKYFDKHYGGYETDDENHFDISKFKIGGRTTYENPRLGISYQDKSFPMSDSTVLFWDFIIQENENDKNYCGIVFCCNAYNGNDM